MRIELVEFRGADGAVIEYGERWGAESPPDDSYSVLSNVERFRPLHRIAEALIDVLANEYAATVEDDLALASELMRDRDDAIRAVKVTPKDPAAASLTFVFTSFPPSSCTRACCSADALDARRLESLAPHSLTAVLPAFPGGRKEESVAFR